MLWYTQGYGTYYLDDENFYEGEFYSSSRSGWGRMYYANGDIYEGEWLNDMRHGKGMIRLGKFFLLLIFVMVTFRQAESLSESNLTPIQGLTNYPLKIFFMVILILKLGNLRFKK